MVLWEAFATATTCIHFISKPGVSDTWAWHTGALLALCDPKGSRQDFPLLQVGKQGLIKVSIPDHSGCKFVHLGPPGNAWTLSGMTTELVNMKVNKGGDDRHRGPAGKAACLPPNTGWRARPRTSARKNSEKRKCNMDMCASLEI